MNDRLVIAEKPSVAQSIAAVLGAKERRSGYMEGNGWLVSWCFGHLAELAGAETYNIEYAKWRYDDLPIVPHPWRFKVSRDKWNQFEILQTLMRRDDVIEVVNACDAGREGELIFRTAYARSQLAQSLWHLRHDFDEPAIAQGYLPAMEEYRGGGFPDETARLADAYKMPSTITVITQEYEQFWNAYRNNRDLLRFRNQHTDEIMTGLHELALPWREYETTKPADLEALLQLLREAGYAVKRGKNISLKGQGQERFVRLSSLGEGYTEAELLAVLTGRAEHTPHKKSVPEKTEKVSLLIDIDAKLRAGKSGGYKQWASIFNAKQMTHTMNYLQKHDLMDMTALKEKTDAATAQFNVLSAQIKSAETRMAEIAILRTQIANYAKTHTVFDEYKASHYSPKYLVEHEADILLHRAAKKAFHELGVKKLPTVKSLQTEYAQLLSQKKAAYPEYKKAREEMSELLTIQNNVAHILGTEEHAVEKEKAQENR